MHSLGGGQEGEVVGEAAAVKAVEVQYLISHFHHSHVERERECVCGEATGKLGNDFKTKSSLMCIKLYADDTGYAGLCTCEGKSLTLYSRKRLNIRNSDTKRKM